MSSIAYDTLVDDLREAIPEVVISDDDLPHVALGSLSAKLVESVRSPAGAPVVTRILAFIETASGSGDPRVRDAIQVSFIESLGNLGRDCTEVINRLGPMTQKLRVEYESRWGPVCT